MTLEQIVSWCASFRFGIADSAFSVSTFVLVLTRHHTPGPVFEQCVDEPCEFVSGGDDRFGSTLMGLLAAQEGS